MKKLSFIILAITLSLCFAGNAWALTGYYVDPTGTDDVSHGTTTGAGAWQTIQYAINSASAGATINVAAGTYKEEVSFVGKSNLLLNGAGEGLTIIAPYREYTASNYGIFINNANEIIIQNLTIDGFANTTLTSGVAHFNDGIHWDALGGNNCIITHVTVKNIDRRGISVWPENVTNNEVSYCTIDNVTGISNGYGQAVKFNGSGKVEHCTISNVTGALLGNCDVTGGTLSIQDNVITNLTGLTTTPFDIGINFWCKQSNVIVVKNNTITANVDDNTGIYVVRGGDGSEISYNTLNLTGNGGLGIETGWENTWGFPIHHNTITMGKGGAGIVITGAGSDADPMLVYDNILTNSGADDLFTNDYTGYSLREVGLLLSGHQYTSRTGDANYSFNGNVYNNSIDGFKDGIVLVTEVYNAGGYKDVEIKLSDENKITNYETAARFGSISYTEPYPFTEIASTATNYAQQNLSMNYWGSASPDFSTVIDGKINYCQYYTNEGLTALGGPVVNANTSVAYCTIQSAIDAATAGDVITVAAGTYNESIDIAKSVTIQGAGRATTFIDQSANAAAGNVVYIHGACGSVKVDGFTIKTGTATTVACNGISVYGLTLPGTITITNNTIYANPSAVNDNLCLIAGYFTITTPKLVFDNNIVHGAMCTTGVANPILIERWMGPTEITNNTIDHGTNDGTSSDVIVYMNPSAGNVSAKQLISGNTIDMGWGTTYDGSHRGAGITIWSGFDGTTSAANYSNLEITNNTLINLKPSRCGISLYNSAGGDGSGGDFANAIISGNTVSNATGYSGEFGIRVRGKATGTQITDNKISGVNDAVLIAAQGSHQPSSTSVTNNSLLATSGYSINNTTSATIAATCNWYGTTVPSAVATKISGNVQFLPFSTSETTMNCDGVGPVTVSDPASTYLTIQSAIDAANSGATITVAAGTYNESVTVNKANLTIQGAGSTATFITTVGATPGITVTANGTTIKNMGITNATELKEGIRINATVTNGLIVDNVNFTNLGNGTLTWDVGPWAYGIHIYGSLTNLDIKNCTFEALSATHTANGVYSELNTTLTTFNLENCLFTNNWNGLFLQSNINGFHAIGNTFGPQEITDMGACVAGIYIGDGTAPFSIDGVIIENNLFTSYGRGIYFCDYGTGGTIGSVDIKDNTFTNSIYSSGIRLMAYDEGTGSAKLDGPLTIDNNTFTQSSPIINGNGVAMIDLRVGAESSTSDIAITNNDITFTGTFTLSTFGMVFRGPIKKMDISGNTLNGISTGASSNMPATSGIVLQSNYSGFGTMSSTADIKILDNDIQGFENGVAVYNYVTNAYGGIPTGSSVDVNNNSLTSNDMAIYSGAGATIAATCNWWGTIVPSEIGAKISGPVVWAPFLLTDNLTTPNCGGESPIMNVTQGLPYSTIQSAIDATTTVDGDVITVAAGTYTEQVTINKDITLQSVTLYGAIIQGNVTISGAGATIDGFQINPITTGDLISVSGNGVTIKNNDIINSLGIGLHIQSGITASGITVTNNKFLAYSEFAVKNDGIGTLDATNNWWGSASGPFNTTLNICASGGEISANITFSPWWVDADMTKSWPGAQDNTITVKNLKATKADISWRRTVGDGSFVLVKQNTAIGSDDLPLDCTSYDHFHTNFTAAHIVNTVSTARIVQYGNSTVCYLTGLVKLTTYYVRVFNYLGNPADGSAKYNREEISKKFATPRAKEAIEGTDALAGTFSVGLIAPNPVTDNLKFALEVADEQAFTIEVYDAEGKTVNQYCSNQIISSGTHNINMTLSNLSSGLYTLVVKTGMDMAITQFIIAK